MSDLEAKLLEAQLRDMLSRVSLAKTCLWLADDIKDRNIPRDGVERLLIQQICDGLDELVACVDSWRNVFEPKPKEIEDAEVLE